MKKRYLLVLCSCVASTFSYADSTDAIGYAAPVDTFIPFVSTNFTYNSNLFALQNTGLAQAILGSTDTADFISMLTAGVNMNWKVSQQVFTGHAIVNKSWFNTYKNLDNNGSDLGLEWDWAVDDTLHGTAGVSETKQLANLTFIQQPINDILITQTAYVTGAVKLDDRWQVNAGVNSSDYTNSAASQQAFSLTMKNVTAGLQYTTPSGTKIELDDRQTQGSYPSLVNSGPLSVNANFTESDNGVKFDWLPTQQTHLTGTLDYTQHLNPANPGENFSGVTGRAEANWAMTGKTALDFSIYRNIQAFNTATTSFQLVQGGTLILTWQPTAKISTNLRFLDDTIDYPNIAGIFPQAFAVRHDQLHIATLGVNYQMLRNTAFVFTLERGDQASNLYGFSYTYNSVTVGLKQSF